MYYTLFFEARGIQNYILRSGKLAEMVGASELLEVLLSGNNSVLNSYLNFLNLKELEKFKEKLETDEVFFSRKNGGAFYSFLGSVEKRNELKDLISLDIPLRLPGLEFVIAIDEGNDVSDVIDKTFKKLAENRNFPFVELPEFTPVNLIAPRTGTPAVKKDFKDLVWIDEISLKHRENSGKSQLTNKFLTSDNQNIKFPVNLNKDDGDELAFPFQSNSNYLALVHADGNSLGKILLSIKNNFKEKTNDYLNALKEFSTALEKATQSAAQKATSKFLEPDETAPIRPLILGGDDLTVIIRPDLALSFTEDFCRNFEEETERIMKDLRQKFSEKAFPNKLTACAGIAYVKSHQPFSDALAIAEDICTEAKSKSKSLSDSLAPPSALGFFRLTASYADSYNDVVRKELTTENKIIVTMGTYFIDENEETKNLPTLPKLRELAKSMKKLTNSDKAGKTKIRHYLSTLFADSGQAAQEWQRWKKISNGSFSDFEKRISVFGDKSGNGTPIIKAFDEERTPIRDIIELISVGDMNEGGQNEQKI